MNTGVAQHQQKGFLMRQLQLVAHGEPSDVIELNTGGGTRGGGATVKLK
jgi:hypothetical protein